jgi:hypothetical protein
MKIDSFLSQHINLTEKILDKAASEKDRDERKADDSVKISDDGKKKRIMSRLIERIVGDDVRKKGS